MSDHGNAIAGTLPEPSPKKHGTAWFIATVIVGVVIIALAFSACGGGDEPYDANNKSEVIAQCEAQVKDHLKSPSTAEFNTSATGSGTWTVTGTVDSENSFGGMVRADFQCTVTVNEDTITTKIDSLG